MTPGNPLGAVPGGPSAPPPPSTTSQLLGTSAAPTPPLGPTPDQVIAGYMDQVRSLHITMDGLATQFPAAGADIQTAKSALANSMAKVASSLAQPEQSPGPPTF